MKKYSFCLLLMALGSNMAFAQKAVMMGKVVNEQGKPVANAELKVSGHKIYYKVTTDNDGLYNTPLIDATSYHVTIDAGGKFYSTEKVKVSRPHDTKEFYNFTLADDHAELHIDEGKDPFMVAKLEKIEADMKNVVDVNDPPKEKFTDGDKIRMMPAPDNTKENAPVRRSNGTVKIIPGEHVPQDKE